MVGRQTWPCLQPTPRPWLALYGQLLKPKVTGEEGTDTELAPIQKLIPDELLLVCLSRLPAYSLGRVAGVCKHWRVLSEVGSSAATSPLGHP